MHYLAQPDVVQLALTDGSALSKWLIVVAGNAFLVFLIYRMVGQFSKQNWGGMVTTVAAAVIVVGFVYFTDTSVALLGEVWTKVQGNT
ncbi:hypothetical protein ACFVUY_38230 [Kitasatospora sp. NPDC058063]|uniref:hypothetical protein n=1 Tax=unclassified Kitasatospora TaxID=2633591 RepID=UPI0036D7EF45